jgi:hypothetical protein
LGVVGNEFDADEGAEVGGGNRFSELYDVWSTAAELFEDRLGFSEDGDPKGLRVCDD